MQMEITIKELSGDDIVLFTDMLELFGEVFDMQDYQIPGKSYLEKLLNNPAFIAFVAIGNGRVLGGLTGHVLPSYYAESSEFYIYDLAVKTAYQRQGVGKKLMAAVAAFCREQNYAEYFVQADEPDQHALEFYRSTGGRAEKVVHFCYEVKKG
jgi:aminoglycoside 3-N-acetyltransferase I